MIIAVRRPGEDNAALMRRFSRMVAEEGILQELKDREFYLKPAEQRKIKARELEKKRKLWGRGRYV